MEPLSSNVLSALAKAIMAQVGKELSGAAVAGLRTRITGFREQKALERALQRAFAATQARHGRRLADYDVNADFLELEGAVELAKAIVPGAQPSATRLAERLIDSLGRSSSDDARWEQIAELRPAFKALLDNLTTEVLKEPVLTDVLGRADVAATAVAAGRIATALGAAPATTEDETRYLRWLIDRHQYVGTAGVVRNTIVQLPLEQVFVGLQARPDRHPGDRARAWFEAERDKLQTRLKSADLDDLAFEAAIDRLQMQYGRDPSPHNSGPTEQAMPVLDAVRTTKQLLVLGEPGSGKTTLLSYLALTHGRALATNSTVDGQAPLFPIYLPVGDYALWPDRLTTGISGFLPHYFQGLECGATGLGDLLRQRLADGSCLVLLDGLDEIASADQRRSVVTAVANFVTAHSRPGNRFIVTSRISGYLAAPLPKPFHAVRLLDMDDPTIATFLSSYCWQVERAEAPSRSKSAARQIGLREAAAITQALQGNPGVRRLAVNPLLLTALVLVHRASGRLPHRRIEAYIEVCNALGLTWRTVRGVAAADLPDERMLTRWLTEMAAWMHEHRPEGSATVRELLEVLGPLWAAHHGVTWDPSILTAADPMNTDAGLGVMRFIDKADRHTGLVVERAPRRYGFSHLTFEEYYTGRALAFRGAASERTSGIRRRLHDPRYEEPILLALGLIGKDYAEQVESVVAEAIHPAAGSPSPYEELLGRDFLFMLRVLADDIPVETATIDAVVNLALDEWLNPTSRCRFASYRTALAKHLTMLGTTRATSRLLQALGDRAVSASRTAPEQFCQLAVTVAPLASFPPPVVAALGELVTTADDPVLRMRAMEALIAGEALSEQVIAAAEDLATADVSPGVRVRAVRALADAGELSDAVIPSVIGLATDVTSGVRVRAVQALADAGRLTDRVIGVLVGLATTDPDPDVRVRAVEDLAAVGALTQPVIAAAVDLATTGEELSTRIRAVTALAAAQALDEALTTAFAGLATTAADPGVRSWAVRALAAGGPLTSTAIEALTWSATTDVESSVRLWALQTLAAAGALTEPVITAGVDLATTGADLGIRLWAVHALAAGQTLDDATVTALVGLVTTDVDPGVRLRAVRALAAGGVLSEVVITTAMDLTGEPSVRREAVKALAAGGRRNEAVISALVELATTAVDVDVRLQAVEELAVGRGITERVASTLERVVATDRSLVVRVRAVEALAAAEELTEAATAAAVHLASSNAEPQLRVRALRAVTDAGRWPEEAKVAAVNLAVSTAESVVRASVVAALATFGPLSDEVTAAAIELAATNRSSLIRRITADALRQSKPTPQVRTALQALIEDESADVRSAAGQTLVHLAREHPDVAESVQAALEIACRFSAEDDTSRGRVGRDEAYRALRAYLEVGSVN
ncbi:HEAT repeat domain-containing protein [Micromonospora sp. NPDC049047]|uniref:HEAT repeat domain-containing protein n=1 Tax=Micromonospora sp. NPDC049047 TaxID=3155645 RepID=UPI0033E28D5C